jgi:hypothetical protein
MSMKLNSQMTKIVTFQNIGFLTVIILCYLDDLLQLPSLIFSGHPFIIMYHRSTLEMLLFLAVWLLVASSTRRLMQRVRHLEHFMRVCAWCRRIDYKGQWMPLEDFLQEGFDTPTTHGICHDCLVKQQESIRRSREQRKKAAEPQ